MDPFLTIKRDTAASLLRHICKTEDVSAIREGEDTEEGEAHRRNCEAARELEHRIEAGTIGDVSVDGALATLAADVLKANETDKVTCPECGGFGYHDDGSRDGRECTTCHGDGTCTPDAAAAYLEAQKQK